MVTDKKLRQMKWIFLLVASVTLTSLFILAEQNLYSGDFWSLDHDMEMVFVYFTRYDSDWALDIFDNTFVVCFFFRADILLNNNANKLNFAAVNKTL